MPDNNKTEHLKLLLNAQYHIVRADDLLISYHEQLGGTSQSILKIAPIVELAQLSRKLGMRVHRGVNFTLAQNLVRCWVDINPDGDNYNIVISDLHETIENRAESSNLESSLTLASDGWLIVGDDQIIQGGILPADIGDKLPITGYIGAIWPQILRPVDDNSFAQKIAEGRFPLWQVLDGQAFCFWPVSKQVWTVRIQPNEETGQFTWSFFSGEGQSKPSLSGNNRSNPPALPVVDTPRRRLFIHSVAPALRAPVVRIMANARTISEEKNGPLRSQYTGYAEDIAQAAEHLLALIDDASDLEAVDGEDFNYVQEDVDLCDVARRAAGLLNVKAHARSMNIISPGKGQRLICQAEFRRVLQIVLNLVGNAIRYGPNGQTITIGVAQCDNIGLLTVSDGGAGISDQDKKVIFDKFERLGRTGDGGSGLGLYISQRLAHAMGGDITVDSGHERGSTFTLQLPIKKKPETN